MSRTIRSGGSLLVLIITLGSALLAGPEDAGSRAPGPRVAGAAARQPDPFWIEPQPGGQTVTFQARNDAHGLQLRFGEDGPEVSRLFESGGRPLVTQQLVAWGRPGRLSRCAPAELQADGARIEYRRGELSEWYQNEGRGLEQGFTVLTAPEGADATEIEIQLRLGGALRARLRADGSGLVFDGDSGGPRLVYDGLAAWDGNGTDLAARMELADDMLSLFVSTCGAVYPVTIDPFLWTEEAKLIPSDSAAFDDFGNAVALSGDTAVVGARSDDHAGGVAAGSATVFVRSGTTWSQQAKLVASDAADNDFFGISVAISGETIVVGSFLDDNGGGIDAGAAYVFVRNGTTWSQQARLVASDGAAGDRFGTFVSIVGETIAVGAVEADHGGRDNAGAVYVFVRHGTSWSQQAKLVASDAAGYDEFGAVSLSGDSLLVGSHWSDHGGGIGAGAAYVFVRNGTAWSQQAKLVASDAAPGDGFGRSVALDGDVALVGAVGDDHSGGYDAGSAYTYRRRGGVWSEWEKLTSSDAGPSESFGIAVSLSGYTAVVGSFWDDHSGLSSAGSATVFRNNGSTWSEQGKLVAADAAAGDLFGVAVATSGDRAVIGALGDSHAGGVSAGSAYVVRFTQPWTSLGNGLAGTYGEPSLSGEGRLQWGNQVTISLWRARERALASLVVGTSALNAPFKGGTLVPSVGAIHLMATDASGSIWIQSAVASGLPPGTPLYLQFWIQDPAGPAGYSSSNAVTETAP